MTGKVPTDGLQHTRRTQTMESHPAVYLDETHTNLEHVGKHLPG